MVHRQAFRPDALFAALGEPTRLALIERLVQGDSTVAEMAEPFAMSLQAVIKHLRVLEKAGLIRRERIGRTNHVSLVPEALASARAWIDARVPAGVEPPMHVTISVPAPRRVELEGRAQVLWESLAPRVELFRRALDEAAPSGDGFDPADFTVRALRAARHLHGEMAEASRLHAVLRRRLDEVARGGDVDALREVVMPLSRVIYELRPVFAPEPVVS